MTYPDQTAPTDQPYGPGATLANRLGLLQNNGHTWMDAPTATTLASAPTTDGQMLTVADSLKNAISRTWDGFSHFYDDQVLHKTPTASLALTRYLNSAIGPMPVRDTDVMHMQQTLANEGFDVTVDGQWKASDNAALATHAQNQVDAQIAGKRPGATTVGGFLRGFVHYLTPSGAGDALLGFVKSIPGDVRQLAADSIGLGGSALRFGAEEAMHPLSTGANLHTARQEGRAEDLWVQQHLWNHNITAADIQSQTTGKAIIGKAIDDIGTALLFSGVGKVGANVLKAGTELVMNPAKVTLADALRAPLPVVVNSLARTPVEGRFAGKTIATPIGRAVAGAAAGGAAGGINADVHNSSIGMGIAEGAVLGAVGGTLIPARAYENLPVLKHTGPILGKLADEEGLYFKARNRLAIPYKYNAVSQAGKIMGQVQLGGLEVGAVTSADNALGQQNSSLAGQVNTTNTLDAVKDATAFKLGVPGYGPSVKANLDDLVFFLHAPLTGAERLSQLAADEADRLTNASIGALGGPGGPLEQFQRGLQAAGKARNADGNLAQRTVDRVRNSWAPTYDALVKMAGSPERLSDWINVKTRTFAAYRAANEQINQMRVAGSLPQDDKQVLTMTRDLASKVLNDPTALAEATTKLTQDGQHYIETALKDEIAGKYRNPKEYLRHELGDFMDSVDIVRNGVHPYADHLITPLAAEQAGPDTLGKLFNAKAAATETAAPTDLTKIGIARSDTLTATDARKILDGFQARLTQHPEESQQIQADLADFAFNEFGLNARKQAVFATPQKLLDNLQAHTDLLSGNIHLADTAPEELKAAVDALGAKGYKLVHGTDIGHLPAGSLPMMDLGTPLALRKRIVGVLGLNPERYSAVDHATDLNLRLNKRISDLVDSNKIAGLPPHWTTGTVLSALRDDKELARRLPTPEKLAFTASSKWHKQDIQMLADTMPEDTPIAERLGNAEQQIQNEIANSLGLRNISRGDVQRVLTKEDDVTGVPLMSKNDADEIYKAITLAYADKPTYMMGLGHVEDAIRALPWKLADHKIVNKTPMALLDVPNQLAHLRDRWRFQMSPMFSFRRVAKSNVKMQLAGVPGVLNPTAHMIEHGTFDAANGTLDRVMGTGTDATRWLDENDKFLHSQDIWGLYNPRRFEAYFAHAKEQQGLSDDEIRSQINRVFNYGNRNGEGRSALERTMNTVFFPFSFEKTLIRNGGAYLLDHPGQAMMISRGLDMYRDFNAQHPDGSNPIAASFWKQHAPLLTELWRLNAFAEGISPGQVGGINAPIIQTAGLAPMAAVNFFMPQSLPPSAQSNNMLQRLAPVYKDFQRIFLGKNGAPSEVMDQFHIVRQASANVFSAIASDVSGHNTHGPLNPYPSTKTYNAQITDAIDLRNKLLADGNISTIVTYNEHQGSDAQKYTWPSTSNVPSELHGQPITKGTVGELVHHIYPAYNPDKGAMIAIDKKVQAAETVARLDGTPAYADYEEFVTKAGTAVTHLNNDDYALAQAVAVQQAFRDRAADMAEQYPGFLAFYNAHYRNAFGPIQRIK